MDGYVGVVVGIRVGVGPSLHSGDFFFFQAEDGIRDYKVTGVQTCALPIYPSARPLLARRQAAQGRPSRTAGEVVGGVGRLARRGGRGLGAHRPDCAAGARSEERRGGEEWRSRWAPDHLKKKIR